MCKVLTPANSVTHARFERKRKNPFVSSCHVNYLDCIFTCPFSRCSLISGSVGLVDVGDFGYQWVVGVGVSKHRADGEENCGMLCQQWSMKYANKRNIPFEMVKAGDHWSRRISKQIEPFELMLG